ASFLSHSPFRSYVSGTSRVKPGFAGRWQAPQAHGAPQGEERRADRSGHEEGAEQAEPGQRCDRVEDVLELEASDDRLLERTDAPAPCHLAAQQEDAEE